ncbi:MAG: hypothetical protein JW818_00545 [Pirellulales bacterium]|nr:hypothetical protein [Pirellulales bacterium]
MELIVGLIYKTFTLLVGVAFMFLGFRLYRRGVAVSGTAKAMGECSVSFGEHKQLCLKHAGPGVFLSLFGMLIVLAVIAKGMVYEVNPDGRSMFSCVRDDLPGCSTEDTKPTPTLIGLTGEVLRNDYFTFILHDQSTSSGDRAPEYELLVKKYRLDMNSDSGSPMRVIAMKTGRGSPFFIEHEIDISRPEVQASVPLGSLSGIDRIAVAVSQAGELLGEPVTFLTTREPSGETKDNMQRVTREQFTEMMSKRESLPR